MKTKIYYKRINKNLPQLQINPKGDGIDLYASETVVFNAPQAGTLKPEKVNGEVVKHRDVTFNIQTVKLGIAMLLPAGFDAKLFSRSSTGKKLKLSLINGIGLIDGPNPIGFCGNNDEWRYPAIAWDDTTLTEGTPFCQFQIQLSQKATFWQKLKWLLSSGIELIEVDELPSTEDRGGGCIRVEENK